MDIDDCEVLLYEYNPLDREVILCYYVPSTDDDDEDLDNE